MHYIRRGARKLGYAHIPRNGLSLHLCGAGNRVAPGVGLALLLQLLNAAKQHFPVLAVYAYEGAVIAGGLEGGIYLAVVHLEAVIHHVHLI